MKDLFFRKCAFKKHNDARGVVRDEIVIKQIKGMFERLNNRKISPVNYKSIREEDGDGGEQV